MKTCLKQIATRSLLTLLTIVAPAAATIINFDAEAAARGGNLTGIPDTPLTIGIATLTGGELLNAEVGLNSDQTGVYASEGLFGSGETNPLTITFASPVSAFSIFVANGEDARSYTVSDNLGDSVTKSLPTAGALGAAVFSLPGNGITNVFVSSANADAWDFAIDNVSFASSASVPEPESFLLIGAALLSAFAANRFKRGLIRHFLKSSANSPNSAAFKSDTAQ